MDGLNSTLAITAPPPLTTYQTPRSNPEPRRRRDDNRQNGEQSDSEEASEEDYSASPEESINDVRLHDEEQPSLGSHIDNQI